MENSTLLPEIKMAESICFSTLSILSEDREIVVDDANIVLDIALALTKLAINKAARSSSVNEPIEEPAEEPTKKPIRKHRRARRSKTGNKYYDACISKEIEERAKAVEHMFNACAMTEMFLAKEENREPNEKLLTTMAKRIAKAIFKDTNEVNTDDVKASIYKDDEAYTVELLMKKNNED